MLTRLPFPLFAAVALGSDPARTTAVHLVAASCGNKKETAERCLPGPAKAQAHIPERSARRAAQFPATASRWRGLPARRDFAPLDQAGVRHFPARKWVVLVRLFKGAENEGREGQGLRLPEGCLDRRPIPLGCPRLNSRAT
jgi:hypothetical protein